MYSKKLALCLEEARKRIAMEEKFVTLTDDELLEVVGGGLLGPTDRDSIEGGSGGGGGFYIDIKKEYPIP